ncbi:hypothetical protein ACS0TY_029880 [Phlomoides rotata]
MKEQPLKLEVYNQGMLKTELCNKWQQTGTCPYGDNCQFSHGIKELHPVLCHPRYKTEVCRMVLNNGSCPYGHRCHFYHSLTDQEQLIRAMKSKSLEPINYRVAWMLAVEVHLSKKFAISKWSFMFSSTGMMTSLCFDNQMRM